MKNTKTLIKSMSLMSSITILLGASSTFAEANRDDYSFIPYTNYGYVGANIGRSDYKSGSCSPISSCDDSDLGYKIYTGGQISRIFGVELGYINIGDFDRNGGHKRGQGADLHLLGNIPLGNVANIYAKAGGVYGWTSTSSDVPGEETGHEREFNWSYGAGLQFEVSKQWAVRADWDQYRMKFADRRDNVALYSLGAIYKF